MRRFDAPEGELESWMWDNNGGKITEGIVFPTIEFEQGE